MATTIDLEKLRKGWGSALTDAAQKIQTAQAAQENAGQKKPTGGTSASGGTAATGGDIVSQYPVSTVYDKDTDYMKLMQDAIARGDYGAAARYEQQRNSKITGEGLDSSLYTDYYSQYLPENRYKYDPTQNEEYMKWRDQQNALYEQIMNRDPFEYNAEADPLYQQYKTQYTALGKNAMRDTMGRRRR